MAMMKNETTTGGAIMKKGDIVEIENTTLGGKKVNEGKARLLKLNFPGNGGIENWKVKFLDGGDIVSRWIPKEAGQ